VENEVLYLKKYMSLLLPVVVTLMSILAAGVNLSTSPVYAASSHSYREFYQQTNLVSDIPGVARFTDPNLVNAWGLSHSSAGPWIISDNGTGLATAYRGDGRMFPVGGTPLVITIPPPKGSSAKTQATPTGNVFNNTNDFIISQNGRSDPSQFIFATEDGTISGWAPNVNPTQAILKVDRSKVGQGAVYKGLAIGHNDSGNFLYATNFRFGTVEMFDAHFNLVRSFTDPQLSHNCPHHDQCFAPFGIQNIRGNLYVAYALQNKDKKDDVAGPGNGFVDIFDPNGKLIRRLIAGGRLNSPWGLALAPNNFGQFSNDLLVGNFGDGHINVFDPKTGDSLGQLSSQSGNPIIINGLWGLAFGNGGLAGTPNTLFFAAGIGDEAHGLFGSIQPENN
jgi:uncharacterized protein (TIGR03118 family)